MFIREINSDTNILPEIYGENIRELPDMRRFVNVSTLVIRQTNITQINNFPPNLKTLKIFGSLIRKLENLPSTLETLLCTCNHITEIVLPQNLIYLDCGYNMISEIKDLPETMTYLCCNSNNISHIGDLPKNLRTLNCRNNRLIKLPTLPLRLKALICSDNIITFLPRLPEKLLTLVCSHNNLSFIPKLPDNLDSLFCDNNKLSIIPILPPNIYNVSCGNSFRPFSKFEDLLILSRFRFTFVKGKLRYFTRLCFYKFIKRRNNAIHMELLFSPDIGIYKKLAETLEYFLK